MRRNTATRPCGRRWRRAIPQAPPSSTPTTCGASYVPSSFWRRGASYAEQKQRLATVAPFVPAVQFGLAVEPAILNERIDARVDAMVAAGLVDEVRGLLAAGFRDGDTGRPQAIGYKEIVEALDGSTTLEEAVQAIKMATRRYGKRQRTWFRRDKRIRWVNADVGDAEAVAAEILSQLETLDAYHG